MENIYEKILLNPDYYRQFKCGDSLATAFDCPTEPKIDAQWTKYNYIVYVTLGDKLWHTAHGSYALRAGDCMFIRKGACIVEQVSDEPFCVMVFFICESLKNKPPIIVKSTNKEPAPILTVDMCERLKAFFSSMSPYFAIAAEPNQLLLELKFRELILTIADNPNNTEILSYFRLLNHEPRSVSLRRVMEDNYCFNLTLEQYAELSKRSLSAFKRDFQKLFNNTPGKWLLEKRLCHALYLLRAMDKTVAEAAFESGFENPSHFSRAFKERFSVSPMSVKKTPLNSPTL